MRAGPRLTGGTARGVRLLSPPGRHVRPALARMRVSVFEILRPRLPGAHVADLFAGTGSLGLEALSRGAARAVFMDENPRCLEILGRNLEKLGFSSRAQLLHANAFDALAFAPADVVFVAPPYAYYADRAADMRRLAETLLASRLAPEGLLVVEHREGEGLGPVAGGRPASTRRYGSTAVTFYERVGPAP